MISIKALYSIQAAHPSIQVKAPAAVLVVFVVCSALACLQTPETPCQDVEFHYQDNLQERPLVLDPSGIWLSAPRGLSDEAVSLLNRVGIEPGDLEVIGETGTYLAPVPAERADTCGVQELVAELARGDEFDAVSPLFLDRTDLKIIHRQVFVIFVQDVSRDEAQQILIDAKTHGLATDALAAGAQLVSTITRNGFEVLGIANRLAGHPRVYAAQPYLTWVWPRED